MPANPCQPLARFRPALSCSNAPAAPGQTASRLPPGATAAALPQALGRGPRCVLVAGGAGFLGANLCRRLLGQGDRVYCLDNLSTGRREAIADLIGAPRFTFLHHDVTVPFGTAERIEQIYNLTGPGARAHYLRDPLQAYHTRVAGTRNLLALARQNRARLLQASDGWAFGRDPAMAGAAKLGHAYANGGLDAQAMHDESHHIAESLCAEQARAHGLETRIARLLHVYGPGQSPGDGRVIPTFVMQALLGAPLTVDGNGDQRRVFLFVDDMLDGLIALMDCPEADGQPVSFGGDQPLAIAELARIVAHRAGVNGQIIKRKPAAPLHLDPPLVDLGATRALLGWHPRTPLPHGLDLTIAHFRTLLRRVS